MHETGLAGGEIMSEYGRFKLIITEPKRTCTAQVYSHAEAIQSAAKERAKGFTVVTKRESSDGTWEVVE